MSKIIVINIMLGHQVLFILMVEPLFNLMEVFGKIVIGVQEMNLVLINGDLG